MNRELSRKGGKTYAFFVDFKAAFSRIDRGILGIMRKIELKVTPRSRIMEIYEETRCVVKVKGKTI